MVRSEGEDLAANELRPRSDGGLRGLARRGEELVDGLLLLLLQASSLEGS